MTTPQKGPSRAVYLPPTSGVPLMPPEYDRYFVKHLTDRLDAVLALHRDDHGYCWTCHHISWPCPTYHALVNGPPYDMSPGGFIEGVDRRAAPAD